MQTDATSNTAADESLIRSDDAALSEQLESAGHEDGYVVHQPVVQSPANRLPAVISETVIPENDDSSALDSLWGMVKAIIEQQLSPQVYAAFIQPLQPISTDVSDTLVLRAPSKLVANHVSQNFVSKLVLILAELERSPFTNIRIEVDSAPEPSNRDTQGPLVVRRLKIEPPAPKPVASPTREVQTIFENAAVNPRYTFEDFVVGNSNQFCHAAAMRVAERPGESYSPLFIYGGVGLGKTHLLHAIGNEVLRNKPSARIAYMSSETFTNELIAALRHARMDDFKRHLRGIEVLLIDDIQFISGKERTQEEFFHTFNALYSAKRQIVITSDKLPTDIVGIEERLQTRFSWGLTADLQAPDFETRVAILKQRAVNESFDLPEEVAHLIAERVSSNVRELEGALTRVHAMSSIHNIPITAELAKSSLKHLFQPKVITLSVEDIKKAVAQHFGIKPSEMASKRRTKNLSFPRHIAMYLCRKHTTASYPDIGEHFGGRDHSSVIHAATVVSGKLSIDLELKATIVEIERSLFG